MATEDPSSRLVSASPRRRTFAKVHKDYTSRDEGVLSLEEDDIVELSSIDQQNGWIYGELNGVKGKILADAIRILSEEEAIMENLMEASPTTSTKVADLGQQQLQQQQQIPTIKNFMARQKKKKMEKKHSSNNALNLTPPVTNIAVLSGASSVPSLNSGESPTSAGDEQLATSEHVQRSGTRKLTISMFSVASGLVAPPSAPTANPSTSPSPVHVQKNVSLLGAPAGTRMLWVDLVGGPEAVAKLGISKKEEKRQEVIFEVYMTEKDYVDDLGIIVEEYSKKMAKSKLVRPKDLAIIFSNLEQILIVNKRLLEEIEKRHNANVLIEQIGDIFFSMSDYLKMYTMYCSNHPYALIKLQNVRQSKAIAKFLDQQAALPVCRNLKLETYLLKPIQRICKYPLLLREIIKNTDESHPDFLSLTQAFLKIESVVTIVNDGTRQAEGVHRTLELQNRLTNKLYVVAPSRVLVKHGTLDLVVGENRKKREVYLFNDILLIAKPDGEKLKLIANIPIEEVRVEYIEDDPSREHAIKVEHVETMTYIFLPESNYTKLQWKKAFSEVTSDIVHDLAKRIVESLTSKSPSKDNSPTDGITSASPKPEILLVPIVGLSNDSSFTEVIKPSSELALDVTKDLPKLPELPPKVGQSALEDSSTGQPSSTDNEPFTLAKRTLSTTINPIAAQAAAIASSRPQSMASLNVVPTTKSAADDTDIFSSNTTNHASYATRLPSQERLGPRPASSFIHVTSVASVARSLPKPGTHTRSATADPPTSVSSSKPPTHARSATADAASRPTSTVRSSWAPSILVPTENATQIDVSIRKVHPIVREMQEKLIAQLATPKAYSPSGGSTPANPRRLSNEGPHGLENRIEDEDAFAKEVVHKIGQITDAQGVVEVAPPSRQESVAGSIVAGTGSQRTSKVLTQGQRPRNMSTLNKPVRSVVISECFRKNHGSAKDYIYVMDVTYITSETNEIRHTYEDFFDFHLQLIGHFPEEAGVRIGLLRHDSPQESTKRLIPQLPGQIMFVTDAVAKSRISPLQEYLKAVLVLPPKISRSPWVLSFFRTNGKNAAAAIERDQLGEVEEADDPIEYDYE